MLDHLKIPGSYCNLYCGEGTEQRSQMHTIKCTTQPNGHSKGSFLNIDNSGELINQITLIKLCTFSAELTKNFHRYLRVVPQWTDIYHRVLSDLQLHPDQLCDCQPLAYNFARTHNCAFFNGTYYNQTLHKSFKAAREAYKDPGPVPIGTVCEEGQALPSPSQPLNLLCSRL